MLTYSDNPLDHITDDDKAARDNLAFVEGFLDAFPAYKGRDTWFSGESYGGVYVPMLAQRSLSDPNSQIYKQVVGITTGNPVFNCGSSTTANQMGMYYGNGLVSWTNMGQFLAHGCDRSSSSSCDALLNTATSQIGDIDQELKKKKKRSRGYPSLPNLDPDDLYQNFCTGNGSLSVTNWLPIACKSSGDLTTAYLRRHDVHKAIHASGPLGIVTPDWAICSNRIAYRSQYESMVPLYQNFQNQKPGFRVLVYSGNADIATVPHAMTSPCLFQVSSKYTEQFQPFVLENGQTAGYYEATPLYTHAILKGAGHETPGYQPYSSLVMFERFVNQGNLTFPAGVNPSPAKRHVRPTTQAQQLKRMLRRNGLQFA